MYLNIKHRCNFIFKVLINGLIDFDFKLTTNNSIQLLPKANTNWENKNQPTKPQMTSTTSITSLKHRFSTKIQDFSKETICKKLH